MIRRISSPPSLPLVVRPRPSNGAEHVPANDPRTDVDKTTRHKVIINAAFAASLSCHLVKGASRKNPLVQRETAGAQRVFEVLVWAGTVSVEGYCEVMDAKFRHSWVFSVRNKVQCFGVA